MPHAGFRFSGQTAAIAARELSKAHTRIVVLSPSHRLAFHGIAKPGILQFETPLGVLNVERRAMRMASKLPFVNENQKAFENEHGIEVTLPWIQKFAPKANIAPFVIGNATDAMVEKLLKRLWGDERTLILISSDLSHFKPVAEAVQTDMRTANMIELGKIDGITPEMACGYRPLRGMMQIAKKNGMRATRLDMSNSYQVNGDESRVVGYGAWAIHNFEDAQMPEANRERLYQIAARSIQHRLETGETGKLPFSATDWMLKTQLASFVSLTMDGKMRGCIGSVYPHRSISEDVYDNAAKAAFLDQRYKPITPEEFEKIDCQIEILSQVKPLEFETLEDVLGHLAEEKPGVVVAHGASRATFLPRVWEEIEEPAEFVKALLHKARLPENFWADDIKFYTYYAERFDKIRLRNAL